LYHSSIFCLLERIAAVEEIVAAFVRAEGVDQVAGGGPERLAAAGGGLAQERLELGEELLNGFRSGE
jgi:hypothetical protein